MDGVPRFRLTRQLSAHGSINSLLFPFSSIISSAAFAPSPPSLRLWLRTLLLGPGRLKRSLHWCLLACAVPAPDNPTEFHLIKESIMAKSVQLALFLLLSYQFLSLVSATPIVNFCGQTHDPRLCTNVINTFSGAFPSAINAQAMLRMHLDAISKRCVSAKTRALRLANRAGRNTKTSLKTCAELYNNAVDLIGVSMRALNANDAQTGQMVQIMLQEIRQSAQQCDVQFQRPGLSNPLSHVSGSIVKMTVNANDLNNLMNTNPTLFH